MSLNVSVIFIAGDTFILVDVPTVHPLSFTPYPIHLFPTSFLFLFSFYLMFSSIPRQSQSEEPMFPDFLGILATIIESRDRHKNSPGELLSMCNGTH